MGAERGLEEKVGQGRKGKREEGMEGRVGNSRRVEGGGE